MVLHPVLGGVPWSPESAKKIAEAGKEWVVEIEIVSLKNLHYHSHWHIWSSLYHINNIWWLQFSVDFPAHSRTYPCSLPLTPAAPILAHSRSLPHVLMHEYQGENDKSQHISILKYKGNYVPSSYVIAPKNVKFNFQAGKHHTFMDYFNYGWHLLNH